jgi:hypothetical protein
MITLEIEKFAEFDPDDVFRISIINDDLEVLTNEDLRGYKNLRSLMLENNQHLRKVDLSGNPSLKYICFGTCDNLTEINIDGTNIENLDLYDLVALETIELDDRQLLDLHSRLSENITRQFLSIEDAILECFERRIVATQDGPHKEALRNAYESYLESSD